MTPPALDISLVSMKWVLLLITAASVHLSLSPPNPPVKREERCSGTKGTDTLFERFVQSVTFCSKCMVWAGVACEILIEVACLSFLQSAKLSVTRENIYRLITGLWSIHPVMIIGTCITATAAILRLWCFKTLGPLFTFELTIRPQHALITRGPYAWVRHPSYTGVYLTLIGATLTLAAPGTWMERSGMRGTGIPFLTFWIIKCGFAMHGMRIRLKAEDEVLKQTFGEEWVQYRDRVPWKLVPGVF